MPGNLLGEALTGVAITACHRDQMLHGRVRPDLSATNLLLNRLGQLAHQRQPARNPRHTPVEPSRKFLQAESRAAVQLSQQPSLFERRFSFCGPQRPVQYQRFGFVHVPNRGPHRVLTQASERPNPLVAIDDQESVRLLRQTNDDDGNLLPPFGE